MTRLSTPQNPPPHHAKPVRTPLFHRTPSGRFRLWQADAAVSPTDLFAGDGLYVIGEKGAAVTVQCELVTEGPEAGCIAVWHLEPRRLLTHWPNARAGRQFILGRVLQPIHA